MNNETQTATLGVPLFSRAHDLTRFTSKDAARYVLGGVHLNVEKKRIEATNGRIAVWLPIQMSDKFTTEPSEPAHNTIIPSGILQRAIRAIVKARKIFSPISEHVGLVLRKSNQLRLHTFPSDDEQMMGTKAIKGTFPNVDNVMPEVTQKTPPALQIALSGELLAHIGDYVAKHSKRGGSIVFSFWGPLEPVGFTAEVDTPLGNETLHGVLMPMRIP